MGIKLTEGGKGEHNVYRIMPEGISDDIKLSPGKHYLGVDAVAWFINKESSWFSNRMASGTLDIKMSSGLEKYQAALGTFELKGGARVAPVFERPVLPDRNFRGGSITLSASLTAIKKDTMVSDMLKSAANASLGIVAGMVQTATLNGPAKILMSAGEDLIAGVKKILTDSGEKNESLFDFSGLEFTIQPELVSGPHIYLLFHRGATLNEHELVAKKKGQLFLPFIGDKMLEDGAWLLLRIRRSTTYSGIREWYESTRLLRTKIFSLAEDVETGAIAKEEALKQLKPSGTGDSTVYDDYAKLRTVIRNDGVLSEQEAAQHVGKLRASIEAAKKAIQEVNTKIFKDEMANLEKALYAGKPLPGPIGKAYAKEAALLYGSRQTKAKKSRNTVPSAEEIFSGASLSFKKVTKKIS